tara:strand:+ start:426 stop:545 length:120 start_codon:yes stop_codon:yes gene_type:complete
MYKSHIITVNKSGIYKYPRIIRKEKNIIIELVDIIFLLK